MRGLIVFGCPWDRSDLLCRASLCDLPGRRWIVSTDRQAPGLGQATFSVDGAWQGGCRRTAQTGVRSKSLPLSRAATVSRSSSATTPRSRVWGAER
ncbi:hypothetical protein [Streptomyces sp. NPDC012756]|uniref:hypothetical protein n=1 Tax=unclassified Streptomyces TaxID=2593676 RepID=UPI00368C332C